MLKSLVTVSTAMAGTLPETPASFAPHHVPRAAIREAKGTPWDPLSPQKEEFVTTASLSPPIRVDKIEQVPWDTQQEEEQSIEKESWEDRPTDHNVYTLEEPLDAVVVDEGEVVGIVDGEMVDEDAVLGEMEHEATENHQEEDVAKLWEEVEEAKPKGLLHAMEEPKDDVESVEQMEEAKPEAFPHAMEEPKDDVESVEQMEEAKPEAFPHAMEEPKDDVESVEQMEEAKPEAFPHAMEEPKDDVESVEQMEEAKPEAFPHAMEDIESKPKAKRKIPKKKPRKAPSETSSTSSLERYHLALREVQQAERQLRKAQQKRRKALKEAEREQSIARQQAEKAARERRQQRMLRERKRRAEQKEEEKEITFQSTSRYGGKTDQLQPRIVRIRQSAAPLFAGIAESGFFDAKTSKAPLFCSAPRFPPNQRGRVVRLQDTDRPIRVFDPTPGPASYMPRPGCLSKGLVPK